MRKTTWHRVGSLLLALAFLAGSGRSLFGLHECLHHPVAEGDHATHGDTPDGHGHAHGEGETHRHGQDHSDAGGDPSSGLPGSGSGDADPAGHHAGEAPCTCLGTCVSSAAPGLPSVGVQRSIAPLSSVVPEARDGTGRIGPRYAPYELPPSTAPPLPSRAIPGA